MDRGATGLPDSSRKKQAQKRAAALDGVARLSARRRWASHWLGAHGRGLAVTPRAPAEFKFGPELWCLSCAPAPLVRLSVGEFVIAEAAVNQKAAA